MLLLVRCEYDTTVGYVTKFCWFLFVYVILLNWPFICLWPNADQVLCLNMYAKNHWAKYGLCGALLQDLELATVWDDHLSYLLSSALSAYELERCTGVSCGNEEFQDAVRRAVPDGHTFKGFPIHFLHRNARRAFAACLRWAVCSMVNVWSPISFNL